MKFFNILQYTRVLQLKYEGLIGPGLLRVETNHWNDGNLSYTTPAVEYSCMWKSGDQKTWLALPEELRDVGPDFYERFRKFGEEMARKVDYIDEESELLCQTTSNPTLDKRTQQALMHATNGTDEKVLEVHIFTSVEESTYPGVLHIHSDDDNLGYFTYGDKDEELKCYWNDPSDKVYKTLKTQRHFYFGHDSIMQSVRFHYDHKDFDRDVRLVADESHTSMFACKFQEASAESVKVIDEVMERIRDEREQQMKIYEKERDEKWKKMEEENNQRVKEFEDRMAKQVEQYQRETKQIQEDILKRTEAQRLRVLQLAKEVGIDVSDIFSH